MFWWSASNQGEYSPQSQEEIWDKIGIEFLVLKNTSCLQVFHKRALLKVLGNSLENINLIGK